ncbi:MAG: peptidase M61, partial [Comamonadaceae bacterium]
MAQRQAGPHYRVEAADPAAHLYHVTLTVAQPQAAQRVSLPAWIPGSYLVREFSRHLQKLAARQGGKAVALQQLDKATWQIDCVPSAPLVVTYEVYAFDNSVRTAWLDTQRGFGTYLAADYDELVDCPVELGPLFSADFRAGGVPHRIVV